MLNLEIKDDAAGIGKLAKVVSDTLGFIIPSLTKKNADAEAYKIRAISEAISDSNNMVDSIDYKSGGTEIHFSDSTPRIPELELKDRAKKRIEFQEIKRQQKIEEITQKAANQIRGETEISEEPVNKDWIRRFFDYAQDVSDDEMQNLWAQILAGEIQKPNSYSIRTLELLRSITKEEANIFVKLSNYAINLPDPFIFKPTPDGNLVKYGIPFDEILAMMEIGLLQSDFSLTKIMPKRQEETQYFATYNKFIVKINRNANSEAYNIPAFLFSKVGKQLLKLIKTTSDEEYCRDFCLSFPNYHFNIEYAFILERTDDIVIRHTEPWKHF